MKYILRMALAGVMLCAAGIQPAIAQQAPYQSIGDQPLMVIRFNQSRVMFERPLYNTISRALEVKPSATFDVVSVAAHAQDSDNQTRNNRIATQNSHLVLNSLTQMGLPQSRITFTNVVDNVDSSEVRIFVH